ncbi:MAG TPA: hypothetical protein DCF63_05855, partial [Planctomycetaceae bacterium]|nr:hypothetical protein [Planctomycetaceae bacterium]
ENSQIELPEYPFDDAPTAKYSQTITPPSGARAIQRWLGLKSSKDLRYSEPSGRNHITTDFHASQARHVTAAIHLSQPAIPTTKVPVAATAYEGDATVDPQALVDSYSLDDSQVCNVSPLSEGDDAPTEFQLSDDTGFIDDDQQNSTCQDSDRCQNSDDQIASGTVSDRASNPALRKPELIKVHQGFSLREKSNAPDSSSRTLQNNSIASPELSPFGTESQVAPAFPQDRLTPSTGTTELPTQASSRRSQQPQAMKLNLNADEVASQPRTPRPPLVPMLVQPAVGNSEAAALQKLMQANHTQSQDKSRSGQEVQAGKISVNPKSVASLKTEGKIAGVSVEHEDICQVMQNGNHTCTLVGLREGTTRVAVIEESNGQRQVKIYGVQVGTSGSAASELNSVLDGLTKTIEQLYPSSDVRLTRREQNLVVSGRADSELSARKILELVRKTTLMPV